MPAVCVSVCVVDLYEHISILFAFIFYFCETVTVCDRLMMIYLLLNIFRYIPDCRIKFYRYVHSTAGG